MWLSFKPKFLYFAITLLFPKIGESMYQKPGPEGAKEPEGKEEPKGSDSETKEEPKASGDTGEVQEGEVVKE